MGRPRLGAAGRPYASSRRDVLRNDAAGGWAGKEEGRRPPICRAFVGHLCPGEAVLSRCVRLLVLSMAAEDDYPSKRPASACGAAARSARVRWVALAGIAANVFTVRSLRDIATRAGVCWAVRATLSPSLGGCFDPGARLISRLGRPDSEEARLLGKVGRRCHQRPPPLSPLLSLLRVTPHLRSRDRVFPARRFGNSGSEVPCPATPRAGAARVRDSRRCGCLLRPVRATPFVWAGHSHPGTRAPESADGATQVLLTTRRNARTAAVRASRKPLDQAGKWTCGNTGEHGGYGADQFPELRVAGSSPRPPLT